MKHIQLSGSRIRIRAMILALILALACISACAAEDGTRTLPIDLSGGKPYKAKKLNYKNDPMIYEDPTIRVEYYHRRKGYAPDGDGYFYFYAFVTIGDGSQLRTASAGGAEFLRNVTATTKVIAKRVNAVLAIDGDFCNAFEGIEGNKYCLRQGTVFRDTTVDFLDMLLIDEDGDFHILKAGPELADIDKTQIGGKKVNNAFQFGPALVIDGEPVDDEYILDPAHSPKWAEPQKRNPRMCIAQIDDLHYFVLATWHGINVAVLRDLVLSITPVKTLYVLDGGNSAQMVFLNSQVNLYESDNNKRTIYDIIYFASAYGD